MIYQRLTGETLASCVLHIDHHIHTLHTLPPIDIFSLTIDNIVGHSSSVLPLIPCC